MCKVEFLYMPTLIIAHYRQQIDPSWQHFLKAWLVYYEHDHLTWLREDNKIHEIHKMETPPTGIGLQYDRLSLMTSSPYKLQCLGHMEPLVYIYGNILNLSLSPFRVSRVALILDTFQSSMFFRGKVKAWSLVEANSHQKCI